MRLLLLPLCLAACAKPAAESALDPSLPTIVYYSLGKTCPYCSSIEKSLAEVAETYKGRVNVDVRPAVSRQEERLKYGITQGHGLVALTADGDVKSRIEGHDIRKQDLVDRVEELLR